MKTLIALLIALSITSCGGGDPSGTDYALLPMKDAWLRHPVLGDPSFDNFTRYEKNPLQRGAPPYEWPVNGFYFKDPVSGKEYIFVGQYRRNYAANTDKRSLDFSKGCIVFCSADLGKTWEKKGPVFRDEKVMLPGENEPIMFAPDVSVVFYEGKYYMGLDFVVADFLWSDDNIKHSGIAVAVSDSPEGPYSILRESAISTRQFFDNPLFGKYNRCYAGTLLKARNRWVFLFMLDSGPHFGWGLVAVSAPTPEGPWSEPVFIRGVEGDYYHPSLMEYYPAFSYQDTVYAPATSVALNRNFQAVFRAPLEDMMNPDKWELWREGSVWHSMNSENEYAGIWGQTITGFIDNSGIFKVMYPGLDAENLGTINLASSNWSKMYRDTGFVFTGHGGPSYTEIPGFYKYPEIAASFSHYGTVAFMLNDLAPKGPDVPRSNATLHPFMFTSHNRIQLTENQWFLIHASNEGKTDTISKGYYDKAEYTSLKIKHHGSKSLIYLNNNLAWQGELPDPAWGRFGLLAMSHSGIEMKSCQVGGESRPGYSSWLCTEGLLNSASDLKDWEECRNNTLFTYGIGAISRTDTAHVKWSFTGTGFDLICPKMQSLGKARIILNGKIMGEINLFSATPEKSSIVYSIRNLPGRKNALVIQSTNGRLAVDCLRVYD
jgi:hypothetical protein